MDDIFCIISFLLDISFLTSLPRASSHLHIFNVDLNQPDSFNAAIEGCIGVFHVAHPMPDKELEEDSVTKKSVQGALGILKACLNSKTMKRVVYTSSAAAAVYSDNGRDSVDESTWSDIEYHRSLKLFGTSYVAAKTKTEQIALKFAEENELELVTLLPPLVVGGFLCKTLPASVYLSLSMILGNQDHYKHLMRQNMVHVDDLVSAHIFLFENPNAKGRYICSSNQITIDEMSQFLSAKYPGFRIPTTEFKHGVDDMCDEAIQCCKEKGFL
ncbi:hypothetical protein DVH24_014098 [Malus domestica]|uniref:Bifunctional dihydroflavonol 4-reductase/flavanone 4-reductase n=1 Tax=Malus domestica TaxID=3750 RepID=A0A498JIL5_MALDO|nr:hypothetical protein DVH24_014098 [Malus domestica]